MEGENMFEPEKETMKLGEIKKMQEEKMKKIVRYAYENVPMYKKRFKEAGITPDSIRSLDDVHKIPFTVKNDLRDHYPYGILAVPKENIVRFHASSGTTGKPTVVGYTKKDIETWCRLMARTYASAGVGKGDIVQNMYGYGLFTGGLGFHYGAETVGATVLPVAAGNTKRQLMLMKDLATTVMACTPSYAVYLTEVVPKEGYEPKKDFKLKAGLFGAEAWSEEARQKIQDFFGLKAYDCYGMSELYGPGVAVECKMQNGLHIWSDEFLIETINPDTGEVLPEGERGEMVFTMLSREAMPLLRYRTRDLAVINWEECECGRYHPRIMRVKGRSDDMLIIGGVNVFPSQIEEVLMNIPELGDQYQIVVERQPLDKLTVQVEIEEKLYHSKNYDIHELQKKVGQNLHAVLGINAKVELKAPGTLPRSEGKAKRVIDLRKQ